jgi:hypothetical protein
MTTFFDPRVVCRSAVGGRQVLKLLHKSDRSTMESPALVHHKICDSGGPRRLFDFETRLGKKISSNKQEARQERSRAGLCL